MNTKKRILICGASIAGPCLAYWLHKYGYSVVVIEKAPGLRDGGQNVDIKGVGQQVIKLMAVDEKIAAMNTQEKGQRHVDTSGNVVASFPKGALGALTSSYEILRGDLAGILYDETKDDCEYRFGTFLTSVDERDDCVSVTFNNGSTEDFELILCAEGFGSSTGGVADRVAQDLDCEHDFYFGPLSQVEASCWSRGRVALVGDAAYCPSPFTGRGTSLALVGAYVLAGEIKKNKTHSEAFQSYEAIVRPYVESEQRLTPRIVRLVHPKTKIGVALLRFVAKLGASKVVQRVLKPSEARHAKASAESFELPMYA